MNAPRSIAVSFFSALLVSAAAGGTLPAAVTAQAAAQASAQAAEEPESHFFTASDGVRIHYLTQGDEGSWVMLVHGYTDSARRMWFRTGIAPVLAENHRVVALDNRNHGESDEPEPNGGGRAEDVIELMDHLGIERAHIHGYSMGGSITGQLLADHPERFITAGFGGSGIREADPEAARAAMALDPEQPEPEGAAARAFANLRARASARDAAQDDEDDASSGNEEEEETRVRTGPEVDLWSLDVPVIAINGEYDRPYSKTIRMWRELKIFQNVVLPGHNHMTAIMVGGPMPPEYVASMASFIDSYDER